MSGILTPSAFSGLIPNRAIPSRPPGLARERRRSMTSSAGALGMRSNNRSSSPAPGSGILRLVPVITIFGAGAMGTALATSLARKGEQVTLWGSKYDQRVLPDLIEKRTHPALPAKLPDEVRVCGPDELDQAAKGATLGVMGAHSGGARSLASMVKAALG